MDPNNMPNKLHEKLCANKLTEQERSDYEETIKTIKQKDRGYLKNDE